MPGYLVLDLVLVGMLLRELFSKSFQDVSELLWFGGSVFMVCFGWAIGTKLVVGEREDLVEVAVVGDLVFFDQLFSGSYYLY